MPALKESVSKTVVNACNDAEPQARANFLALAVSNTRSVARLPFFTNPAQQGAAEHVQAPAIP